MNGLFAAAAQVQRLCEEEGWNFCFIGGMAVLRWGEPRLTRDVDVTLVTGYGGEEPYVRRLLERFESAVSTMGSGSRCATASSCCAAPTASPSTSPWRVCRSRLVP